MSIIINIETSGARCSVAVSRDGIVEYQLEDTEGMKHAERLAPFVEKCMDYLARRDEKADAVAVSIGPGSYTGLRIGLSMAKGLCFSLDVPLIGVSTLKLLAVKAMFRDMTLQGDEVFLPMIDARRMEVFTGVYDFALKEIVKPGAKILDEDSFQELSDYHEVILIGDGAEKAKDLLKLENLHYIPDIRAHARDMVALSEKAFRENDFLDLAYSVPEYLKDFQATTPKNKTDKG